MPEWDHLLVDRSANFATAGLIEKQNAQNAEPNQTQEADAEYNRNPRRQSQEQLSGDF